VIGGRSGIAGGVNHSWFAAGVTSSSLCCPAIPDDAAPAQRVEDVFHLRPGGFALRTTNAVHVRFRSIGGPLGRREVNQDR
jgi:hypothetical protein